MRGEELKRKIGRPVVALVAQRAGRAREYYADLAMRQLALGVSLGGGNAESPDPRRPPRLGRDVQSGSSLERDGIGASIASS